MALMDVGARENNHTMDLIDPAVSAELKGSTATATDAVRVVSRC